MLTQTDLKHIQKTLIKTVLGYTSAVSLMLSLAFSLERSFTTATVFIVILACANEANLVYLDDNDEVGRTELIIFRGMTGLAVIVAMLMILA